MTKTDLEAIENMFENSVFRGEANGDIFGTVKKTIKVLEEYPYSKGQTKELLVSYANKALEKHNLSV